MSIFDTAPDRRNSGSYKWDSATDANVIPLWVADMDFKTAPAVLSALEQRVKHGVFGYVKVRDEYYQALTSWFSRRHGWNIDADRVIYTSGVVPAISAIIKALTRPGDGVITQTPAYNCFFSSIRNNGCRLIENKLVRTDFDDNFTYNIDFDDLEQKAAEPTNKILILCNPHNPSGRVWTVEELTRIADICHRNNVTVISDEIHCELTMPGYKYTPYHTIDNSAIVCCSPSKAFNIAGLQIANIICPNAETQSKIDRAINDNEVCDVNPFGVEALIAAYNEGEQWLNDIKNYLHDNYTMLRQYFADNMPQLRVCKLEATYLAWIDIRALNIDSNTLETIALEREKVWINAGEMYGCEGYIRINMACPRERLHEGLNRLKNAIATLSTL